MRLVLGVLLVGAQRRRSFDLRARRSRRFVGEFRLLSGLAAAAAKPKQFKKTSPPPQASAPQKAPGEAEHIFLRSFKSRHDCTGTEFSEAAFRGCEVMHTDDAAGA